MEDQGTNPNIATQGKDGGSGDSRDGGGDPAVAWCCSGGGRRDEGGGRSWLSTAKAWERREEEDGQGRARERGEDCVVL